MNKTKVIDFTTDLLKTIIVSVGPKKFFTALHNSFVFGEVLNDAGVEFDSQQLEEMFVNFENLVKISKGLS